MSTTQTEKVFPGLLNNSVEFFHDGNSLRYFSEGRVKSFHDLSYQHTQLIREAIENDAAARYELERMHPDSEYKRIEQFAICNFSGLDHKPDIKDGVLQKGEYWQCPLRGLCPGEGKICKQLTYEGQAITSQEINLIRLVAANLTNETIAGDMMLPMGTFHLVKKKLYDKLAIMTKHQLVLIARQLNII